jgi:hypothetical protein
MKRMIIAFALFYMGMFAFGQVTLSGEVETGAQVVTDPTGTKIRQYDWNEGYAGWGQIILNAKMGDNASAFIYLRTTDLSSVDIAYIWATQKYFKDALEIRAGNMYSCIFMTPYEGFNGIDGQGVQAVVKFPFGLSVGGFIPMTTAFRDISSVLSGYKVGAQFTSGFLSILGTYTGNGNFTASASATFGGLWAGFETQYTKTTDNYYFCPYVDYTTKDKKFEIIMDSWTDNKDLIMNSTTALYLNYWFVPEFRILGMVAYVPTGNVVKVREGFVVKPFKSASLRIQNETAFGSTITNTVNLMMIHSF